MEMHRHRGIRKLHYVQIKHKNKLAREMHNLAITKNKKVQLNYIKLPIDGEGFISLNLDSTETKGLRVTMTREYNGGRRTIGLQIDNLPYNKYGGLKEGRRGRCIDY